MGYEYVEAVKAAVQSALMGPDLPATVTAMLASLDWVDAVGQTPVCLVPGTTAEWHALIHHSVTSIMQRARCQAEAYKQPFQKTSFLLPLSAIVAAGMVAVAATMSKYWAIAFLAGGAMVWATVWMYVHHDMDTDWNKYGLAWQRT
jgi:hypothetical protein